MYKIQYFNLKKILFLFFTLSMFLYPGTVRIMPLGDSITYDNAYTDTDNPRPASIRSAYRNYLWYKLKNAKYDIDFVGSRVAGTSVIPSFDPDNEGYPGYTSYQISNIIYAKLQQNQPDIILLHIGSNDGSDSVVGVRDILDEIDRYEENYHHHIKVVLARIINRREYFDMRARFNVNLQNLANNRIANGDDIYVVDMEHDAGIYYDNRDFQDLVHPNDSGYAKMATVWFDALKNILKDDYAWLIPIYNIIL